MKRKVPGEDLKRYYRAADQVSQYFAAASHLWLGSQAVTQRKELVRYQVCCHRLTSHNTGGQLRLQLLNSRQLGRRQPSAGPGYADCSLARLAAARPAVTRMVLCQMHLLRRPRQQR